MELEEDDDELENWRGDERPRAAANVDALLRKEYESNGEEGDGEEEEEEYCRRQLPKNVPSSAAIGERSERNKSASERERPCLNVDFWGNF